MCARKQNKCCKSKQMYEQIVRSSRSLLTKAIVSSFFFFFYINCYSAVLCFTYPRLRWVTNFTMIFHLSIKFFMKKKVFFTSYCYLGVLSWYCLELQHHRRMFVSLFVRASKNLCLNERVAWQKAQSPCSYGNISFKQTARSHACGQHSSQRTDHRV